MPAQVVTADWNSVEPWYASVRMLSVLYNSCLTATSSAGLQFTLEAFLRSLEPYLNITQVNLPL